MRLYIPCFAVFSVFATCSAAYANTFRFDSDPFAGTNVLNVPGRQIVGGEEFINFSIASDVFSLDSAAFGVSGPVNFVNAQASGLPTGGVNVVVLQTFDDDNNPLTPFGAGNAADLIGSHITTPGPGFFIYFNQSLDLPRLVFSSDLSSSDADLKILARMLNLFDQTGRNAMPTFTASNFDISSTVSAVPEPSGFSLLVVGGLVGGCFYLLRRGARLGSNSKKCGVTKQSVTSQNNWMPR
jgi:hypothetical protein